MKNNVSDVHTVQTDHNKVQRYEESKKKQGKHSKQTNHASYANIKPKLHASIQMHV